MLRATCHGRSVFRRPTRRRAPRPARRAPGSRPPRPPPRSTSLVSGDMARGVGGPVPPRRRRWPARTRCRRRPGCAHGRMVCASPSWAATATRRHAAGLSAASVATTAMVVFSGLFSRSSSPNAAICSAGGARQPELVDQVCHPRQAGRRVDDVAGRIDDDDRADGHADSQLHRGGTHAALEHSGTGADPGADGAVRDVGVRRRDRRRGRTPPSAGNPIRRRADRRSPRRARSAPGRRPSRRRGRWPPASPSRRRRPPGRRRCRRSAARRRRTARCWTGRAGRSRGSRAHHPARRRRRRFRAGRAPRWCRAPSPSRGGVVRRAGGDGRRGSRRRR